MPFAVFLASLEPIARRQTEISITQREIDPPVGFVPQKQRAPLWMRPESRNTSHRSFFEHIIAARRERDEVQIRGRHLPK